MISSENLRYIEDAVKRYALTPKQEPDFIEGSVWLTRDSSTIVVIVIKDERRTDYPLIGKILKTSNYNWKMDYPRFTDKGLFINSLAFSIHPFDLVHSLTFSIIV